MSTWNLERLQALQPYLIPKAKRGIVGKSTYAVRLRRQIMQAASDRRAVIIFGEPGLEKDNIAALIHFGSPQRREPLIQVNCNTLQSSGLELFGRADRVGLLEWLAEGTLLLNNVQELPPELVPKIIQILSTGTYTPLASDEDPHPLPRSCAARILAIAEKSLSALECCVGHLIKVPPLRVRKADIKPQIEYYISLYCRARGIARPQVAPEVLRQLQSYPFPNNLRELRSLVERAIVQADGAATLSTEIFWTPQIKAKRYRWNLLNAYPWLRSFLRGAWWTDRLNYGLVLPMYTATVAILFLGPQIRAANVGLNLFWAWWWPVMLLAFPLVGRVWCAVCPFMIYGELMQKLSLRLYPRQLKRWNRTTSEQWGGWVLFGLFTAIYLWEELWDLRNTAYLSAWLLLLITAGAVICSLIFERRFWCRYLCPIGGMNGLFAKLAVTELRAQQGICSAECTTYQCYKGGAAKGEGLETDGCPLYTHPAHLQDNRDCVLCMTCLKACPHRSVELNLRPPGIDLWTTHIPRAYEVALLLLLLGGVSLHRLAELQNWLGLGSEPLAFLPHAGLAVLALVIPVAFPLLAQGVQWLGSRWRSPEPGTKPTPFLRLAYGYLPLVLGANLAHHLQLGLSEAGRILPVTLATLGQSGSNLPILVAHPAVISFLQGSVLIVTLLCTIALLKKIAGRSPKYLLPHYLSALVITAYFWAAIV